MKTSASLLLTIVLLSATPWMAGCDDSASIENLSVQADSDPEKLKKAQAETEAAAAKARAAEAKKTRGAIKVEPNP